MLHPLTALSPSPSQSVITLIVVVGNQIKVSLLHSVQNQRARMDMENTPYLVIGTGTNPFQKLAGPYSCSYMTSERTSPHLHTFQVPYHFSNMGPIATNKKRCPMSGYPHHAQYDNICHSGPNYCKRVTRMGPKASGQIRKNTGFTLSPRQP